MTSPSLIFLIGYRGTGKSTVGRIVADRLGWTFLDADERIESVVGRTIADIFAAEGESGFRDREAAILAEVRSRTELVVATGGGSVLRPANRELFRAIGYTIWLSASVETAWSRLEGDTTTATRRPNLTDAGGLAEVRALMAAREPLYRECADSIIDVEAQSPEAAAAAILSAWNGGITCRPQLGASSPSSSG